VAPQQSRPFTVALPPIVPQPGVEYWLDLAFALKADRPWAKAGHVLAREQLKLPFGRPAPAFATAGLPELSVAGGTRAVEVSGRDFAYGFDPASGLLTSIRRCSPARCGPISGARPTTTTAAAT